MYEKMLDSKGSAGSGNQPQQEQTPVQSDEEVPF
jgi:hypothetical protein